MNRLKLGSPASDGPGTLPSGPDLGDELGPPATKGQRPTTGLATSTLDEGPPTDLLLPFAPAIMAVRWATTGVSLALASPGLLDGDTALGIWITLILANTAFRTFAPLRFQRSIRPVAVLVTEIGFHVVAVIATGFWNSPLVLGLINAVIIAGFARGFGFALRVGAASTLAVALPGLVTDGIGGPALAQSAQWATLVGLSGVVAGYSRRISGEASRRHNLALDRVARLADANALLTNLHRVTQTLPASLDLDDVIETTVTRLRSLLPHDVVVVLVTDQPTDPWRVAGQTGAAIGGEIPRNDLPAPARQAISGDRAIRSQLGHADGSVEGFAPRSTSGVYLPLLARGRLIGLLAVESASPEAFGPREQELLEGFVEPVALAIDNARWFDRIRTLGASEERTRIARDLHDRLGQSLAYLGFELDRVIRRHESGADIGDNLGSLRSDLRELVGEMRDTLSDLRTDVTDTSDFAQTADAFIERLRRRSALTIELDVDARYRPPLLQEREMWRIAQEALTNVERHAGATNAVVRWRCDERGVLLEVSDNGRGFLPGTGAGPSRADAYGIVGMRERADSIGAVFDMTSEPGEGTTIRCFLTQR